jgi:hypothetical protein
LAAPIDRALNVRVVQAKTVRFGTM